jgi:hypothetical protein
MTGQRPIPTALKLTAPPAEYAVLVAQGLDGYREALNLHLAPRLVSRLEAAKAEAERMDDQQRGLAPLQLGDELMQMRPVGAAGGNRWVFGNDDFLCLVRSPKQEWGVTVRYSAAGLWEHGIDALRARAHKMLFSGALGRSEKWSALSRVDYCFDYYSPAFTVEMKPGIAASVVMHSQAKQRSTFGDDNWRVVEIGHPRQVQTLDLGRYGGLQVELYDKTREIKEASGKEWMRALWAEKLDGEIVARDVWRLECRFGKDGYLKERGIRDHETLMDLLPAMIAEALATRRLTRPNMTDSNPRRWPMHELWSLAFAAMNPSTMPQLGRTITGRPEEIRRRLLKQIAGTIRAIRALSNKERAAMDFDDVIAELREVYDADRHGDRKDRVKAEQYRNAAEAQ